MLGSTFTLIPRGGSRTSLHIPKLVLALLIILLLTLPTSVMAERKEVKDKYGFSTTEGGVTNEYYDSSNTPCVLFNAGKATLDMDLFFGIRMSFKYRAKQSSDEPFYVFFENSEDSGNSIRLRVITPDSTKTSFQTLDEYGNEQKHSYSENKDSNTYHDMRTIDIQIVYTSDGEDGKTKDITVKLSGSNVFSHEELYEPELSADIKERQWDRIVFEAPSPNKEFRIDNIVIVTEGYNSETYAQMAPTTTAVVAVMVVGVAVIYYWYSQKGGSKKFKKGF